MSTGQTNYSGVFLAESAAYGNTIWGVGTETLYAPNTPTRLAGSNQGNFLQGGSADDTLQVMNLADRVSGGAGIDTVTTTVNFTLPNDVENMTLSDQWGPVFGVGNNNANLITTGNNHVTIDAKGGDDVIVGGGGDTFIFGQGSGRDVLYNFHPGSTNTDLVRLDGYGLASFAQIQAAMTQVGADVQLQLSATDLVLFKNTTVGAFNAGDFQCSLDTSHLKLSYADDFNSFAVQSSNKVTSGWATSYVWDKYDSLSAHTIFGEAEIYVDPAFKGAGATPLGLNPFSVANGVLSITANPTSPGLASTLWDRDYTSGVITTKGSFAQTYGYFEIRADIPEGKGFFPAFWLLSDDDTYNEIDVFETVNENNTLWNHIHAADPAGHIDTGFKTYATDLAAGFHTFGVLWTAQTISWYVDGGLVAQTATPASMNKPMYMLANLAVGGSWAGDPDASTQFPNAFKIDYIHAYTLENSPVPTPTPTPTPTPGPTSDPSPGPSPEPSPLTGTTGDDVIAGPDGQTNYIRGGEGADQMTGGSMFDDINGNLGNDTAHGGGGDDWVVGGRDNDLLYGDAGLDIVYGNLGADTLDGGSGADILRGGRGDDLLRGGRGNDWLSGDLGSDTIWGGDGADTFHAAHGVGMDRIADFSRAEGDHVLLDAGTTYTVSQSGADVVIDMGGGDQMILLGTQMSSLTGAWLQAA